MGNTERGVSQSRVILYRLGLLTVLLVSWQYIGRFYPSLLSYPTKVLATYGEMLADEHLFRSILISLRTLAAGWAIASFAGIFIGLLLGRFRRLSLMFEPFLNALYATPRIALVPLMVLWFGLSYRSIVVTVVLMAIFPAIVMTLTGVRNAGRDYVEVARSFCMSERAILFKVILPGALPYIGTGLRLASGRAVTGMVVGEMFIRGEGIGTQLMDAQLALAVHQMFGLIIIIALIAVMVHQIVSLVEHRLQSWQPRAFD